MQSECSSSSHSCRWQVVVVAMLAGTKLILQRVCVHQQVLGR
jgi:hypothetical protein